MMQSVNSPQSPINIFAVYRNPSQNCKIDGLAYDQDIDSPKTVGLAFHWNIHRQGHRIYKKQKKIQEEIKLRKHINKVKCEIQSHIIGAGYTQREAVEACSAEYGWSESDSNFSNKLEKQTLRYREALELAEVLGYEIVWQKRRGV